MFQRRLAAALQAMDPAWRSAFIDYEKLRKQVKNIVSLQQQEASTHNADTPCASSPPTVAMSSVSFPSPFASASSNPSSVLVANRHKQRINRYHQQFHTSLQLEMQQMNTFFVSCTITCTKLFDQLGLDHVGIQHQQVHPIATLAFAKVLLDTFPSSALLVLNPMLVQRADQTRVEALEPRQIALFRWLLHLCYEIDQLRKYCLINHAILWKLMKKYDKHTGQDTQKTFLHTLNAFDFSGNKCSELVHRAQCVGKKLLQQDVDEKRGGACSICLRQPMADALLLSCAHGFCFTCLLHQPTFWHSCPICRREDDWDAHMLSIENVVSDCMAQCISTAKEEPSPLLSRTPTAANADALPCGAVVATAFNNDGVNSALQQLPPFLQQALLSAVSSAAVTAVNTIKNGGGVATTDQINTIQAAVNAAIRAHMGQLTASSSPKPAQYTSDGWRSNNVLPFTLNSTVSSSVLSSGSDTSPVTTNDTNLSPSAFLLQPLRRHGKNSSQGVSCHQCKTNKQTFELHFCSSQTLVSWKDRQRKCRKKYCETCLRRSYPPVVLEAAHKDSKLWPCPSCLGLCICAACTQSGGLDHADNGDSETEGDHVSVANSESRRSFSKSRIPCSLASASPAAQLRRWQSKQPKRKALKMRTAIAQLTASDVSDQASNQLTSPQSATSKQQQQQQQQQQAINAERVHLDEAATMLAQQPRLKLSASSPSLSWTLAELQHQQQPLRTNHSSRTTTSGSSSLSSNTPPPPWAQTSSSSFPLSPQPSPLSDFSPSISDLDTTQFESSSSLSSASNSPTASNNSSPINAAAILSAKRPRIRRDSSNGSSLTSSLPSSPSHGATTTTYGQHFPSTSSRRTSNTSTQILLNAQAVLDSRHQALKQQQQHREQREHIHTIYHKLKQQTSPQSAAPIAAATIYRNASVPSFSSPYVQPPHQSNNSCQISFPPLNSISTILPHQHNLHPSAPTGPAASIPALHAVPPLSSLPSPSVSAASLPGSHLDQMLEWDGSSGSTGEDGFDPLMALDGDRAGNSETNYMFPPFSPPSVLFSCNQQQPISLPTVHDSDPSLLHLNNSQQPNVSTLNEHDAALPLYNGSDCAVAAIDSISTRAIGRVVHVLGHGATPAHVKARSPRCEPRRTTPTHQDLVQPF